MSANLASYEKKKKERILEKKACDTGTFDKQALRKNQRKKTKEKKKRAIVSAVSSGEIIESSTAFWLHQS